jgi:hypothetical protein
MAAETQYTANTAIAQLTTGNSYMDGTEAVTVLTAASNGTLIKTVTIKATGNTTEGMVRLFAYEGSITKLIAEVKVPIITRDSRNKAFEVILPLNLMLEADGILKATTANSETFNVIAEGLDWVYYTTSVRPESTNYTANTGFTTIATANTYTDGKGDMEQVIAATSSGTQIQSINIKSQVSTTPGMIRLYLYTGSGDKRLFLEIAVPYVTKSATAHSFSHRIDFGGRGFALKSGWSLWASTANSESFNVIAEGLNWEYPA